MLLFWVQKLKERNWRPLFSEPKLGIPPPPPTNCYYFGCKNQKERNWRPLFSERKLGGGGGEGFRRVATRESFFFLINEDNSAATRLRVKIEYTTAALIVAYETE